VVKTCFKCGETKPIAEFYAHPKMADGRLGKCKVCTRADVKKAYRASFLQRQAYEKERAGTPRRKLQRLQELRRARARYPEKFRARAAVANAINRGHIKKEPCGRCGAEKAEAHHHDYSKPLDVEWLCFRCHREAHGHGSAKGATR
jgi:hypothetical protein